MDALTVLAMVQDAAKDCAYADYTKVEGVWLAHKKGVLTFAYKLADHDDVNRAIYAGEVDAYLQYNRERNAA